VETRVAGYIRFKPIPVFPGDSNFEDWFHVPSWKRTISPVWRRRGEAGPLAYLCRHLGSCRSFHTHFIARSEHSLRVNDGSTFPSRDTRTS